MDSVFTKSLHKPAPKLPMEPSNLKSNPSKGLLDVPIELLDHIASSLDFEDFVNLQLASPLIRFKLSSCEINPGVAAEYIGFSKEGQLAKDDQISDLSAAYRVFSRREAFARNRPSCAVILGYGSSYLYRDGTICYFRDKVIRILDVHANSGIETVIDLDYLLNNHVPAWGKSSPTENSDESHIAVEFLNYNENVLFVLVADSKHSIVIGIDTGHEYLARTGTQGRVCFALAGAWPGNVLRGPNDRSGVKIRNTDETIYYFSSHQRHNLDHREWALFLESWFPRRNGRPRRKPHVRDLFRTWPGQSIILKEHYDTFQNLCIVSNKSKVAEILPPGADQYPKTMMNRIRSTNAIDFGSIVIKSSVMGPTDDLTIQRRITWTYFEYGGQVLNPSPRATLRGWT